ncbi:big defensin-like [Ylistrum balloti]|uniref:big defensin-like n=1 Tax=Ylistrum balloti TaxID=509963 RepID=UPI002905BCC0|nr:big defensin-like [Ylistrum balloti]
MVSASLVRCYAVFYVATILLAVLCPVFPASVPEEDHPRQKRAIPLVYVGAMVAPHIFRYLVTTFGAAAVTAAGVKIAKRISDRDSHSCRGNRGWCRSSCRSYEREDRGRSDVCGRYKCCVPK